VHFAFTDQQLQFRDAVHQVLAKECTPDDVRAAYDDPRARGPRWATLTDLGVVGLTVPEPHGGLGLGLVDLVPLLTEAGAVALPEPLLETTALAAPLVTELTGLDGDPDGRLRPWSEGIAAGRVAAAVGDLRRPGPVAGAVGADLLVLAVDGPDGDTEIHLAPGDAIPVTPVPSLDPTRRLGLPSFTPGPTTWAASGPVAEEAFRRLDRRAAVATAAQLVGLADRLIRAGAEYVKERRQFGVPVGSFQAVKHLLAGAQVRLEFARPVVAAAAWALDEAEPDAGRSASVAKACAAEAATEAARVALQVHGAIGYTWECDLHLFLKRAWALAEAWGSAADHRRQVLASLVAAR
jgi:alkylation response protein AidB-like acyl-CoA dehydrogenase